MILPTDKPRIAGQCLAILGAITQRVRQTPRVVISQAISTAMWDTSTNTVHIGENVDLCEIAGFVAHEARHVLFTDEEGWQAGCAISHPHANACEDMRVNLGYPDQFSPIPGTWIMDTWRSLEAKGTCVGPNMKPSSRVLAHVHQCQVGPLTPAEQGWIDQYLHKVLDAQTCMEMVKSGAVQALKDLDKQQGGKGNEKETQPGQDQGNAQGNDSGSGDGKGNAEGEGTGNPFPVDPAGKRRATTVHVQSAAAEGRKRQLVAQGEDKGTGSSRSGSSNELSEWPNAGSSADYAAEYFDALLLELAAWRARVHEALMAKDRAGYTPRQKRGVLDGTRLTHVAMGSEDVFKARASERRAVNTAIDMVVDISGSMEGRRAGVAQATAYSLANAISRVPGTRLGVLLFDSNSYRIRPIISSRCAAPQTFKDAAVGLQSTNTEYACARSAGDLMLIQGVTRRIQIIITDDCPPEHAEAVAISDMGVELYCICVAAGEGVISTWSEMYGEMMPITGCTDASGIPECMTQIIDSMLRKGKV